MNKGKNLKRNRTSLFNYQKEKLIKSAIDVDKSSEDSEELEGDKTDQTVARSKSANYEVGSKYKKNRFTSDNYQVKRMEIKRNASEIGLPEKKVFINRYNRNMKLYTMYKKWIFAFRCQQLFSFLGLILAAYLYYIR